MITRALFAEKGAGMSEDKDNKELYIAIWSKAVETQMHFNEMSVKSRQFGLGFVAAALGLGIVMVSRNEDVAIPIYLCGGFDVHVLVLILFAAAFAMYAVKLLDLNVYHKMLRGAVAFNEDFERNYMKQIFDLDKGMTEAISHFSRHADANVERQEQHPSKYRYIGASSENAETKIRRFYFYTITSLLLAGMALFLVTAHFGEPGRTRAERAQAVKDAAAAITQRPQRQEPVQTANPPQPTPPGTGSQAAPTDTQRVPKSDDK